MLRQRLSKVLLKISISAIFLKSLEIFGKFRQVIQTFYIETENLPNILESYFNFSSKRIVYFFRLTHRLQVKMEIPNSYLCDKKSAYISSLTDTIGLLFLKTERQNHIPTNQQNSKSSTICPRQKAPTIIVGYLSNIRKCVHMNTKTIC